MAAKTEKTPVMAIVQRPADAPPVPPQAMPEPLSLPAFHCGPP